MTKNKLKADRSLNSILKKIGRSLFSHINFYIRAKAHIVFEYSVIGDNSFSKKKEIMSRCAANQGSTPVQPRPMISCPESSGSEIVSCSVVAHQAWCVVSVPVAYNRFSVCPSRNPICTHRAGQNPGTIIVYTPTSQSHRHSSLRLQALHLTSQDR